MSSEGRRSNRSSSGETKSSLTCQFKGYRGNGLQKVVKEYSPTQQLKTENVRKKRFIQDELLREIKQLLYDVSEVVSFDLSWRGLRFIESGWILHSQQSVTGVQGAFSA